MGIIIAVLLFSFIIIFHELGHFLLAKKNGIRVDEFSLGLGPTLLGKQIGETKFSLKLLPFGGACMMGEDDADDLSEGSFNSKSVWARMSVVAAGPIFNLILACVFCFILIMITGYRSPEITGVLDGYSAQHGLSTGILAYLDFGGATGSSKDGLAETMLAFATERGTLQPGMPVVEASSGSFGAALAVSCATTGHPCILVVPSNLPIAQRKRLQDLGAHIIACSSSGRRAMERVAEDTAKRYGGYYTHYFSNDDNPEYHRRVTGPQIYKNAGDAIDAIVIGVGSGGTITGVAEYIKAWNSMVRIVAVEPAECAAISGGFIGQHGISGIGPGFVPENYNPYVVDTVLTVTTADAERAAREVLFFDGVPACTSAGATLAAAVQLLGMGKSKRPLCVFAGRHIYG